MLRGIDPILTTAGLIQTLSDMGHGDEIVIGDGNYASTADATRQPVIWLGGYTTAEIVMAILQVMPLDDKDGPCAYYIVEKHSKRWHDERPVSKDFASAVRRWVELMGKTLDEPVAALDRPAFHDRARRAYAVVATNDPRHYACFILRKGAIPEPCQLPRSTSEQKGAPYAQ